MKHVLSVLIFCSLSFATSAKGGHCAHGHSGHYVHAAHSSKETDVFADMRQHICAGYIVYHADTVSGIIVCTDNRICIKTATDDSTALYKISDTALQYVALEERGNTVNLQRLAGKGLFRVFHTGKLSIYDACFTFDHTSKKFYNELSWVRYNNHSEKLNGFFTTGVKRKLIDRVNQVYGLTLDPKNFKRTELLAYIDKLN
jgi:hypothetical protein